MRSDLLPGKALDLPAEVIRPAVRRQSDLPKTGGRAVSAPCAGVLVLENWALPEHVRYGEWSAICRMEGDIASLVRAGASKSYKRAGKDRPIPELSAVRTNVRLSKAPDQRGRHWYHLPPLKSRHTPALFVARVNNDMPIVYRNVGRRLVIDANFSTLWIDPEAVSPISSEALLALLSSSWTQALLEMSSTVMGGGALKVEASHLRRLLLPRPDPAMEAWLHKLGLAMTTKSPTSDMLGSIDHLVAQQIFNDPIATTGLLRELASRSRGMRRGRQ